MWDFQIRNLETRGKRGLIFQGARRLTFRETYGLWQGSSAFACEFARALAGVPFDAFFWETPAVTFRDTDQPFEFVVTEALGLATVRPDAGAFQDQFAREPGTEALSFPNLGGDAVLVVPGPVAAAGCYTHLARFVREAPEQQVVAFWKEAGAAMERCLEAVTPAPRWLSTAGMGVSWLHLRIDARPKYYRYRPYTVYPLKSGGE